MKKLFTAVCALFIGGAALYSQMGATGSDTVTSMEEIKPLNAGDAVVELKTTMGDIYVDLYNDTPLHRENFLKLVGEGFYDGVLFHRVIDNFMVQTGDPSSKEAVAGQSLGSGDPGYTIEAEIDYPKHYHKYGALAAARTGDNVNPEKRSSGSQFYIVTGNKYSERQLESMESNKLNKEMQSYFQNLAMQYRDSIQKMQAAGDHDGLEALRQQLIQVTEEHVKPSPISDQIKADYVEKGGTPHLDGGYTVFGEVIKGMDVVEKIQKAETDSFDRPKEDIRIISAKVIEK